MPNAFEQAIERALAPGRFVSDRQCWDFVGGLDKVQARIPKRIEAGHPEQAVELYETFIAGCYAKSEEVDDSSGSLGMFVGGLFCRWIEARQAAGADPGETAEILLGWMDNDDYGYCHRLEEDAVKSFDQAGLAAFESLVRKRFEAPGEPPSPPPKGPWDTPANRRRRAGKILRAIYAKQRDVEAYAALAEAAGLTPQDCEAIAQMYQGRRDPEQALHWVERGLALQRNYHLGTVGSSYKLSDMQRELLERLGRGDQSLALAWAAFEKYPATTTYQELMRYVPEAERDAWCRKALTTAEQGALDGFIGLCAETGEWTRLAERLRRTGRDELAGISHYTLEAPARTLAADHPDVAAEIYGAMGLRILGAGKSKYYAAALKNLERAKELYAQAGLEEAWTALVEQIRRRHGRKHGFMPGFEDLVSGVEKPPAPGFLEQARKRWPRRG